MKVMGLDHLFVNVRDLDASLRFYGEVLGLEVLRLDQFRRGEVGFVSVRVSAHSLIDLRPVDAAIDGSANVDHFCLIVEPGDMEAMLQDLRRQGVETHGPVSSRWGAQGQGDSFTIIDPDGNTIELKCYGRVTSH